MFFSFYSSHSLQLAFYLCSPGEIKNLRAKWLKEELRVIHWAAKIERPVRSCRGKKSLIEIFSNIFSAQKPLGPNKSTSNSPARPLGQSERRPTGHFGVGLQSRPASERGRLQFGPH